MIRSFHHIVCVAAAWAAMAAAGRADELDFLIDEPEPLPPPAMEVHDHLDGYGGCHECCEPSAGLVGSVEATFFRYHRADGTRFGTDADEDVEFDLDYSPRTTLGYAGSDGLGVRFRWWHYEERGEPLDDDDGTIRVDTYTLDWEVFDTIQVNCNWTVEISGGLRFSEFEELLRESDEGDSRENDFDGFGGVVGLEVTRCIAENIFLFARLRGAILMDDKLVRNRDGGMLFHHSVLLDSTQGMLELALGFECSEQLAGGATLFARFQGEWQNWFNYSSAFNPEFVYTAPSDVGFGGIAVSLGMAR